MEEKIILKRAKDLFSDVLKKNSFLRYDLRKEWEYFAKYQNDFKDKNKRFPFVYDVLDCALKPINPSLQNHIKSILYEKDYNWFLNIGQYLFYNLFQWINNFKKIEDKNDNEIIIDKNRNQDKNLRSFLEEWWAFFCNYEDQIGDFFRSNRIPLGNPNKILLELTGNCNLDCIMCGIGKNGYDPSKNLPLEILQNLSKDVLRNASLIRLNGLGESTFIPNFKEYFEIISKTPARLEIVTNLTVQKDDIWDLLINRETLFLISCDSAIPSHYEAIRRGAKFDLFKKNLKKIGENVSNPILAQIIFTLMENNINDLLGVLKMAMENGVGGVIVNVVKNNSDEYLWMVNEFDKVQKTFQDAFKFAKDSGIHLKLPDHLGNKSIDPSISTKSCNTFCDNPWNEIYIRYNGDLTVCNMLNPYIYGNCKNYPFKEIWNGLNSNLFRNFVNTKYRHTYCKQCYYLV